MRREYLCREQAEAQHIIDTIDDSMSVIPVNKLSKFCVHFSDDFGPEVRSLTTNYVKNRISNFKHYEDISLQRQNAQLSTIKQKSLVQSSAIGLTIGLVVGLASRSPNIGLFIGYTLGYFIESVASPIANQKLAELSDDSRLEMDIEASVIKGKALCDLEIAIAEQLKTSSSPDYL